MVTAQAEEPDLMLSTSSKILTKYNFFSPFQGDKSYLLETLV